MQVAAASEEEATNQPERQPSVGMAPVTVAKHSMAGDGGGQNFAASQFRRFFLFFFSLPKVSLVRFTGGVVSSAGLVCLG